METTGKIDMEKMVAREANMGYVHYRSNGRMLDYMYSAVCYFLLRKRRYWTREEIVELLCRHDFIQPALAERLARDIEYNYELELHYEKWS